MTRKVLIERRETLALRLPTRTVALYVDELPPDFIGLFKDCPGYVFELIHEDEEFILAATAHH